MKCHSTQLVCGLLATSMSWKNLASFIEFNEGFWDYRAFKTNSTLAETSHLILTFSLHIYGQSHVNWNGYQIFWSKKFVVIHLYNSLECLLMRGNGFLGCFHFHFHLCGFVYSEHRHKIKQKSESLKFLQIIWKI